MEGPLSSIHTLALILVEKTPPKHSFSVQFLSIANHAMTTEWCSDAGEVQFDLHFAFLFELSLSFLDDSAVEMALPGWPSTRYSYG